VEEDGLKEAQALYDKARQGLEDTLHTTRVLAVRYAERGELEDAEAICKQVQGFEKVLGRGQLLLTLRVVCHLGTCYAKKGMLVEARVKYMEALEGYNEAIGPNDLEEYELEQRGPIYNCALLYYKEVLYEVNVLGSIYFKNSQLVDAKALYDQVLESYKGLPRPEQLNYVDEKKLVEAEAMYGEMLEAHACILENVEDLGILLSGDEETMTGYAEI
jgi:tetratricopeptide (TPR) repeat protein